MKQLHNEPTKARLIMYSEQNYIMHLGEKYGEKILQAEKNMEPVISVVNINGCQSSIPLERALDLLEKYHKLQHKLELQRVKLEERQKALQAAEKSEQANNMIAENMRLAGSF